MTIQRRAAVSPRRERDHGSGIDEQVEGAGERQPELAAGPAGQHADGGRQHQGVHRTFAGPPRHAAHQPVTGRLGLWTGVELGPNPQQVAADLVGRARRPVRPEGQRHGRNLFEVAVALLRREGPGPVALRRGQEARDLGHVDERHQFGVVRRVGPPVGRGALDPAVDPLHLGDGVLRPRRPSRRWSRRRTPRSGAAGPAGPRDNSSAPPRPPWRAGGATAAGAR